MNDITKNEWMTVGDIQRLYGDNVAFLMEYQDGEREVIHIFDYPPQTRDRSLRSMAEKLTQEWIDFQKFDRQGGFYLGTLYVLPTPTSDYEIAHMRVNVLISVENKGAEAQARCQRGGSWLHAWERLERLNKEHGEVGLIYKYRCRYCPALKIIDTYDVYYSDDPDTGSTTIRIEGGH